MVLPGRTGVNSPVEEPAIMASQSVISPDEEQAVIVIIYLLEHNTGLTVGTRTKLIEKIER